MVGLLEPQETVHPVDVVLPDGHQEGVLHLDAGLQQELDQLKVLVLYGDHQSGTTQGVDAVQVEDLIVRITVVRLEIVLC